MNLNAKIVIAHRTLFDLGVIFFGSALLAVIAGIVTLGGQEFVMPSMMWCALAVPVGVVGAIMIFCSVRW